MVTVLIDANVLCAQYPQHLNAPQCLQPGRDKPDGGWDKPDGKGDVQENLNTITLKHHNTVLYQIR